MNVKDCYYQLGRTQLSLANYHQAMRIDPGLGGVRQRIATLCNMQGIKLSEQGKHTEALFELTEAAHVISHLSAKSPIVSVIMQNRIKLLLRLQSWNVAREEVDGMLKLDPTNNEALLFASMWPS